MQDATTTANLLERDLYAVWVSFLEAFGVSAFEVAERHRNGDYLEGAFLLPAGPVRTEVAFHIYNAHTTLDAGDIAGTAYLVNEALRGLKAVGATVRFGAYDNQARA